MQIEIGDRIEYRPSFGTGTPILATVTGIDRHKGRWVVDLDNSSWAYFTQIDRIYEKGTTA